VLVAFTLLAIGLGILLSILSGGVHAVSRASDATRASLYAESLFDSLGADRRLRPGRTQGSFESGRYRWTLDITSYQTPKAAAAPGGPPQVAQDGTAENVLLHVVLQMQWNGSGSGNQLRVDTLRAYTPAQDVAP
jgi:general secretion pathway protein I